MAGGTWSSQNKVRPGVYIRFKSTGGLGLTVGERGTVAICEPLSWGPVAQVMEIESGADMTPYTGYDITNAKNCFLKEIFKGSNRTAAPTKVLLFRPAANGSVKASATAGQLTATAKYPGVRGNDISVVITELTDPADTFTVSTVIDGIDGVGAVQVYPVWNGAGTVKCSVMGADYLPASTTLVNNVQNAIDPEPNQGLGLGLAPIGSQVTITSPTKVTVNISAAVTLATGYTLDQVTPIVKASLEAYLLSVRKSWGEQLGTTEVKYAANVYISRILASIVSTTGIVNAVNVQLNGQASDLILIESGSVQQVPVLGEVTLSA